MVGEGGRATARGRGREGEKVSEETNMSEPTAEDAVAGMLLRYGFDDEANDLATGYAPAAQVVGAMCDHRKPDASRDACVAALEALARGDLRGARDQVDLLVAIDRLTSERDSFQMATEEGSEIAACLTRERDEARAEVDRLRARDIDREARALRLLADAGDLVARAMANAPVVPGKPDPNEPPIDNLRPEDCVPHEVVLQQLLSRAKEEHRRLDEGARVLREALRRAVHHLGTAAPVNDEESLVSMDDFHAAKMLVGRTDDAWDDAAAERGMRSIRREALGTDDEAAR